MQGRREVRIEHSRRHGLQQAGNVAQGLVDVDREATFDVVRQQFAKIGCRGCRALQYISRAAQVPQRSIAIGGQVSERIVAGLGCTVGAELRQ